MVKILKIKKIKRQERIFKAAFKLFNEKGFSKTSMKEIAQEANLGVGTLYNYYPSKSNLLIDLNKQKTENLLKDGEKYLEYVLKTDNEPQEIIKELLRGFVTFILQLNKDSIHDLFAAFFNSKKIMKEGIDLDLKVLSYLQELLKAFQAKGQIDQKLDVKEASHMLYGIIVFNILGYIYLEDGEKDAMVSSLHKQIDILFKGFK